MKFGMIVLVFASFVAGCATPPKEPPRTEIQNCIIQPLAAQDGMMYVRMRCENE